MNNHRNDEDNDIPKIEIEKKIIIKKITTNQKIKTI